MPGYSCSDCKEGDLIVATREIELKEGETVAVLGSGVVIASRIACSNDKCDSHAEADAEEEEEEEKPKRKKRTPAAVAQPGQARCTRSDLCSKPYAHTGACNKLRQAEE